MADEPKRRGLGRGLSALFADEAEETAEQRRGLRTVPIERIRPGRFQPRRHFDPEAIAELAESIREKGILQPLLVRADPEVAGAYELIAGERRWRAAQQAQLHEVPVIVRDLDDRATLEVALIENLQREDLNPLEEAAAYARLMSEFNHTQVDLARAVGKSRSHVANSLRLLGLPQAVRGYVADGKLSAGHARTLIGHDRAEELAHDIVTRGLSVRQAEAMAQARRSSEPVPGRRPVKDADTLDLERRLGEALGLTVRITDRGGRGEIVIGYGSYDQLEDLTERLAGAPPRRAPLRR